MFNYTRYSINQQINHTITVGVFVLFMMSCTSGDAYGVSKTQHKKETNTSKYKVDSERKNRKNYAQDINSKKYIVMYPPGYEDYGKDAQLVHTTVKKKCSKSSSNKRKENKFIQVNLGGYHPSRVKGNVSSKQIDKAYVLGAGIGYIFNDNFRGNLEYNYFTKSKGSYFEEDNNISNHWDLSSHVITTNAVAYLWPDQPIDLYAKVGIGMSVNHAGKFNWGSGQVHGYWNGMRSNSFVWQGGVGMNFYVNKEVENAIEYMFIDRGVFQTRYGFFDDNGSVPGTEGSRKKVHVKDHIIKFSIIKKF